MMHECLQGVWAFRRTPEAAEEWLFEVFPDGRLAQYHRQHPSLTQHVCMTMRAEKEAKDSFRVKSAPDAVGYVIEMRRVGVNLVVVNKGLLFVCRRVSNEELPSWLPEVRAKAVWR